jgi:hypothetical protein
MFEKLYRQRAELTKLIERHTSQDGTLATEIPSLFFSRYSTVTGPTYGIHNPSFCHLFQNNIYIQKWFASHTLFYRHHLNQNNTFFQKWSANPFSFCHLFQNNTFYLKWSDFSVSHIFKTWRNLWWAKFYFWWNIHILIPSYDQRKRKHTQTTRIT